MTVDDVFTITGRGVVATGRIEAGILRVGDEVRINGGAPVRVDGIEMFRRKLEQAQAGDNVGLLFSGRDRGSLQAGDVITGLESAPVATGRDPRFAEAEARRVQLLSMRDAGLMTDAQIEEALRGLMFPLGGRYWVLTASNDAWWSSDGGPWKQDTPPP